MVNTVVLRRDVLDEVGQGTQKPPFSAGKGKYFLRPRMAQLFWGHFMEPAGVIGNTFTITMVFSKKKLVYTVSGMGRIVVKLPEALPPTDDYFKGIGTRSTNGDGPCVVYFDDVYVLK